MAKGKGYDLERARSKPKAGLVDVVTGRTGMPFAQQNVGAQKVMGGPPTRSSAQLRGYANQGLADKSVARARADAIDKSDKMNREAMNMMKAGARERKAASIRAKRPK